MGKPDFWLALFSVAFGWLLAEASYWLRTRREDRRAIGRALTNLLLVRHRLHGISLVTSKFQAVMAVSAQQGLRMQHFLDSIVPDFPGLQAQYEEALKIVSGARPMLGERLYRQGSLELIRRFRELAMMDPKAADMLTKLSTQITDAASLDDAIRTLGWLHGWTTWLSVRALLRQPVTLPLELETILDQHIASEKGTAQSSAI